ncbi:MAG: hypothetical protein ABI551_20965 [Polyangiaceae bacterium]
MFQTSSNDIFKRTLTTVVIMVGACAAFVGSVSLGLVILIGQVKGGTSSDTTTEPAASAAGTDQRGATTTVHSPAVKAHSTAYLKPAQRI